MQHLLSTRIHIFLTIVEAGSITGAAARMNMGKSAVSEALKQLEASLETKLLIRTTRRQSLTPIGTQFYRSARALKDQSTIALEEISANLAEPIGPLRITAPHATIQCAVAPAIAALVVRHPKIEPDLIVDDKRLDLIGANIDLALSVGELKDSEFKTQKVGTVKDILCAAPETLSKADDHSREAIEALPYVAHHWEGQEITHQLEPHDGSEAQMFRFRRVATASSVDAVLSLIRCGVGIGVLPHFALGDQLHRGELVQVLPDFAPRQTNIYAIHPYGAMPPLSVRLMIEALKKELSSI